MFYIFFFLLLTYFILAHSEISLYYALHGMTLWYSKMVPSLLPFMILSGTLIRLNLTEYFVVLFHPLFKRIFRCRPNVTYGIVMGFLCGFPMGAKVAVELLEEEKITKEEAEFLLSFCNNIGPVYICSFVIPTLKMIHPLLVISIMYGIPLIYGCILRYFKYRTILDQCYINERNRIHVQNKKNAVKIKEKRIFHMTTLLSALDTSIQIGINSIISLCGYMIIFNVLNILPHFFWPQVHKYIGPFLEITGGIGSNTYANPYYILVLLPFGGLSCLAQTYSIIRETSLSIKQYVFHKLIITALTAVFYLLYCLC